MNENIVIAFKVVPVILIIALGIILEKTKFINDGTVKGMKKIVLNISLPSLLFLNFLRADLKPKYLLISLVIFATCAIGLAMGFLFKKLQRSTNQFYPSVYSSFVTGLLGYPLFISVFGSEQLYKLAILDIGNLTFIFTILLSFLDSVSCDRSGRTKIRFTEQIKKMAKSPVMVGMLLGILISMSGKGAFFETYPATSAIVTALTMFANTSVPIILLVMGYELHFDLKNFIAPVYAVLLRVIMMLSFAYFLNTYIIDKLLGLDEMFQMAVYTMFVLPPTFIIPVFIEGECEEKGFILNFLSIHVIFSIAAFIAIMTLVR
ncbi:hypothetical protein E9840_02955 [Tissierella creatinini]|nr:hypothetical protein E9840_02955 [Tissierella creatinini]TJX67256.1 hypothetical protein E8P77_05630 [Soehngenia saccharolytica]